MVEVTATLINAITSGGSTGVGMGILYLIYKQMERRRDLKNGNGGARFSRDDHDRIKSLYDSHNVRDKNGKPIWYVGSELAENQEKMIEVLEKMHVSQKRFYDYMVNGKKNKRR